MQQDNDIFTKPVKWQRNIEGSGPTTRSPSNKVVLTFFVGLIVVIVISVGIWRIAASAASQRIAPTIEPTIQPTQTAALILAAPAPTGVPAATTIPTPTCTSAQGYLTIIAAQEAAGDARGAAVTTEAALRISGFCDADRQALQQKAISAGMAAIYTAAFSDPLDTASQQQLVEQYEALRAQAHENDIAIDSDLQVARRAFAISQFQLAKAALDNVYVDHQFNPRVDRDITQLYVSTCYSLGTWYITAQKDNPIYAQGLAWLVASHALSVKYHTGQGEAATKLAQLISAKEADWPTAAATPLLSAL